MGDRTTPPPLPTWQQEVGAQPVTVKTTVPEPYNAYNEMRKLFSEAACPDVALIPALAILKTAIKNEREECANIARDAIRELRYEDRMYK